MVRVYKKVSVFNKNFKYGIKNTTPRVLNRGKNLVKLYNCFIKLKNFLAEANTKEKLGKYRCSLICSPHDFFTIENKFVYI